MKKTSYIALTLVAASVAIYFAMSNTSLRELPKGSTQESSNGPPPRAPIPEISSGEKPSNISTKITQATQPASINDEISKQLASGKNEDLLTASRQVWICQTAEIETRAGTLARISKPEDVEKCRHLKAEYRRDYLAWLDKALAANTPGATAQFILAGPNGNIEELTLRPSDPIVVEWKQKAIHFLLRDATSGSPDAIAALSAAYLDGVLTSTDSVRALAYQSAANKLQEESGAKPSNSRKKMIEYLTRGLNQEQIRQAKEIEKEFLKTCCEANKKTNHLKIQ